MTTYRLMDGVSGRPGNGPSTGTSYSGPYIAGNQFCVTQGGLWFEGYWWWVAATGQDTGAVKCALWQLNSASTGLLVPGTTVTSGALTAGQWNFIPLTAPILLAPSGSQSYGAVYNAAIGYTASQGFPSTLNQFGTGDPFAAGITNGPLFCCSSTTGSAPPGSAFSWNKAQMPFSTVGADPSVLMPGANDHDDNLWVDVQVSDTAPVRASYRGFSAAPAFVVPGSSAQASAYTLGLQFAVSQPCALTRIWHYSPPGATVLPTRCAIWDVASQTVVAGSDNTSPTWSGAAASGWVSCDYSSAGVALAAGTAYKVATFTSDNTDAWFLASANWWGGSPGPFTSGLTTGPLTIPGNAGASPGQDSWHQSTTWTYPGTSTNPEFDGIDVEVTPTASSSGLLMATFP